MAVCASLKTWAISHLSEVGRTHEAYTWKGAVRSEQGRRVMVGLRSSEPANVERGWLLR